MPRVPFDRLHAPSSYAISARATVISARGTAKRRQIRLFSTGVRARSTRNRVGTAALYRPTLSQ
eukprot:165372-Rhodomonas_salina.6